MNAPALPAADIALRTDPGRDPEKQVNEDACADGATPFGRLVVVCDGMGGHAGGREASQLAVRTIFEAFAKAPAGTAPRDVLAQAIREANRRVFTMTTPIEEGGGGGRPGSTVVAALMHGDGTEIAHVGDSRAYLVHQGQIFQLTKDHSSVQRMVDEGLLSPSEAARHPDANKILRALGIAAEVDVDVRAQPVPHVAGDVLVLCTDGLSDLVTPEDVLAIAGSAPAAQAAGQLVDLANARGGHDNVTVAILRAKESAARARDVAPTVTETMAGAPAAKPLTPTLLQTPGPPLAVLGRAAAGPHTRPSGPRAAAVALAIALGLAGAALVIFLVYRHNEARRGESHVTPGADGGETFDAPNIGHVHLVPLEAVPPAPLESVEAGAGIEPLAPLEPPDAGRRRRHR